MSALLDIDESILEIDVPEMPDLEAPVDLGVECEVKRKPKQARLRRGRREAHESAGLSQWLRAHGITHCHVPNEALRTSRQGWVAKWMGLENGVPDHLIFDIPPAMPTVRGVAIEMKSRRAQSRRMRDEQRDWLIRLEQIGWLTRVTYGCGEAIEWLHSLGYGTITPAWRGQLDRWERQHQSAEERRKERRRELARERRRRKAAKSVQPPD